MCVPGFAILKTVRTSHSRHGVIFGLAREPPARCSELHTRVARRGRGTRGPPDAAGPGRSRITVAVRARPRAGPARARRAAGQPATCATLGPGLRGGYSNRVYRLIRKIIKVNVFTTEKKTPRYQPCVCDSQRTPLHIKHRRLTAESRKRRRIELPLPLPLWGLVRTRRVGSSHDFFSTR